jgi:hypothetical protein
MFAHQLVSQDGTVTVTHLKARYYGAAGRAAAVARPRDYVLIDFMPHLNGRPFTGRIETTFGAVSHYQEGRLIGKWQSIATLLAPQQELLPMLMADGAEPLRERHAG